MSCGIAAAMFIPTSFLSMVLSDRLEILGGGGGIAFVAGASASTVLAAIDCRDFPRVAGLASLIVCSLNIAVLGINAGGSGTSAWKAKPFAEPVTSPF